MMNFNKRIVNQIVVNAWTIATSLIWVDVIKSFIETIVPSGSQLEYKFGAAVIATLLTIIAIYLFLKTESKAEEVLKELRGEFGETVRRRSSKTRRRDKGVRRQA
jgi:hypothetical protein